MRQSSGCRPNIILFIGGSLFLFGALSLLITLFVGVIIFFQVTGRMDALTATFVEPRTADRNHQFAPALQDSSPLATNTPRPTFTPLSRPTPTHSPVPRPTDTPRPTATPPETPTLTAEATPIPLPTEIPRPGATSNDEVDGTLPPTSTPEITPAPLGTPDNAEPRATLAPRETISTTYPITSHIAGHILFKQERVQVTVTLSLKDQRDSPSVITTTTENGSYIFSDLVSTSKDYTYTLFFEHNQNQQYADTAVFDYIKIGPMTVVSSKTITLPDLDIANFDNLGPGDNTTYRASLIASDNPIRFLWEPHPNTRIYEIQLTRDEPKLANLVWQRTITQTNMDFDGRIDDGTSIRQGAYWWRVIAEGNLDHYGLKVYNHFQKLNLDP